MNKQNKPDFKKFARDENGLLKNVDYIFREDGYVDWRAMVGSEFLGVKNGDEEKVQKKYKKDISDLDLSEVEDRFLFVFLGGIKRLAQIRGVKSVYQNVNHVSNSKAVVTCTIEFIGNYETNGEPLIYSDTASASFESVHRDFTPFLESIAANRAFVRCVRNALGINIVGKDELSTNHTAAEDNATIEPDGFGPQDMLRNKAKSKGLTFSSIKSAVIKKYVSDMDGDPNTWEDFGDISPRDCFTISTKIDDSSK